MKFNLHFLVIFSISVSLFSQVDNEFKDSFVEAQSYFQFDEYEEALPIYSRLLRKYPYNNNLKYLVGRCLLLDPYQAAQSIKYLEEASKYASPDYKPDSYKETTAPLEALFYLAEAYHKNNMLDKAINQYNEFLEAIDEKEYDKALILKRIESCKYAKEQMQKPVEFKKVNLGDKTNTSFEEFNPVISGDGKILAFTRKLQFYDAIFVSEKTTSGWTEPVNIIENLGVDGGVITSSLNYKGNVLYLYNIDNYNGNIYMSVKDNSGTWGNLIKLNSNINTKFWESNAFESPDGNVLYFSSNRPGGVGRLDLYMSHRVRGFDWGPAVNLGSGINTGYNEDAPILTKNGNILIFASYGHTTIGDYDNFYCVKENDNWSVPFNLGYPFNTVGEELMFSATDDGTKAYLALIDQTSFGLKDIYVVDLNIKLPEISVNEKAKADSIARNLTNIQKQKRDTFSIALSDLLKEKLQKQKAGQDPVNNPDSLAETNQTLTNNPVTGNKTTGLLSEQKVFNIQEGTEIVIPIQTEPNSKLSIKVYNNNNLTYNQQYNISDSNFIFKYKPSEGSNIIELFLTDPEGNKVTEKIVVNCTSLPSMAEDITTIDTSSEISVINIKEITNRIKLFTSNKALIRELDSIQIEDNEKGLLLLIEKIFGKSFALNGTSPINDGYTSSDFISAILNTCGLNKININEFYNILLKNTTPSIREYITGIKINEQGFTPVSLIEYLIKSEPSENFTLSDIYQTLNNLLSKYGPENKTYVSEDEVNADRGIGYLLFVLILLAILIIIYIVKKRKTSRKNKS